MSDLDNGSKLDGRFGSKAASRAIVRMGAKRTLTLKHEWVEDTVDRAASAFVSGQSGSSRAGDTKLGS